MPYTSSQLALFFEVKAQTIRNWSEEFAEYLTNTTRPGINKNRVFSVEDAEVLSLVASMKKQRLKYEDIHASLKSGQRGDAPALPPEDLQLIVSGEQERRLDLQIEILQTQLVRVQNELVQAKEEAGKVYELREEKARLETELKLTREQLGKSESDLQQREEQLEARQKRIEELSRQLGEEYARGVMEALERRGDISKKAE